MSFADLVKNKKIVVVGPAPSIVGSNQGKLIDSYDLVVRINKALPVPPSLKNDIGSKTDILYNCLNTSPECGGKIKFKLMKDIKLKYLCGAYPPIRGFAKDVANFKKLNKNHKIKFRCIDTNYYINVEKFMGCRPNSGICAILDLLQHDIKELYITGFSFFKGGYYKQYRNYNEKQVLNRMAKVGAHNQEKQMKYMKNILLNDSRVKMDDTLSEIIKQ